MSALNDPSKFLVTVTPSDSVSINGGLLTRGLYVGTAGNVSVLTENGSIVFVGVIAGSILPIRISRVNATNTTAADIVALF